MTHTEFVQNITVTSDNIGSQTPFQITSFDLNPGKKETFPFFSQIAANYELYDWEGLMFQFRPTSGEFGASAISNALGKVVMSTRYGISHTNSFQNTIEMQNYAYASSCKPCVGIHHGIRQL